MVPNWTRLKMLNIGLLIAPCLFYLPTVRAECSAKHIYLCWQVWHNTKKSTELVSLLLESLYFYPVACCCFKYFFSEVLETEGSIIISYIFFGDCTFVFNLANKMKHTWCLAWGIKWSDDSIYLLRNKPFFLTSCCVLLYME